MLEELKDFNGRITVNGMTYTKNTLPDLNKFDSLDIYLEPCEDLQDTFDKNKEYEFTVKEEMTEYGRGQQNFHKKWNNGVAMPYRRMSGKVLENLDSVYKVELHKAGVIWKGYILKDFINSIEEIK